MTQTISFSPFTGYELPYEHLVQFCLRYGKNAPPREQLRGPTCIVAEFELTAEEKESLARQAQVRVHAFCICITFDGSDDEKQLVAGLRWCANVTDGFAYVILPEVVPFLDQRQLV